MNEIPPQPKADTITNEPSKRNQMAYNMLLIVVALFALAVVCRAAL